MNTFLVYVKKGKVPPVNKIRKLGENLESLWYESIYLLTKIDPDNTAVVAIIWICDKPDNPKFRWSIPYADRETLCIPWKIITVKNSENRGFIRL